MPPPSSSSSCPFPYHQEIHQHIEEALLESVQMQQCLRPHITFAGMGEPTLRWPTTSQVVEELRRAHPNVVVGNDDEEE